MRVFVTGATGFIGSAIVQELLRAGHEVTGLVRSEAGAAALAEVGAKAQNGTLEDLEGLRRAAADADGVIHAAFDHDFSRFAQSCEMDRAAIAAIGSVLKGSGKPFLVAAGMSPSQSGRMVTEEDEAPLPSEAYPRASELTTLSLAQDGVNASVVRLPPSVHGEGDHAFVPNLISVARASRSSAYVGEGRNRWPAVHRADAASLFRLALERGATGARYHAVAEEGVELREIAGVIAKRLDVPLVAMSQEEAADHFGWFAFFAGMDAPASSEWTRNTLGWSPVQPDLIEDVDKAAYFED